MLRGSYRDQLADRVDAEEIMADLLYFAQFALDVFAPEQADIEPQMLAEAC